MFLPLSLSDYDYYDYLHIRTAFFIRPISNVNHRLKKKREFLHISSPLSKSETQDLLNCLNYQRQIFIIHHLNVEREPQRLFMSLWSWWTVISFTRMSTLKKWTFHSRTHLPLTFKEQWFSTTRGWRPQKTDYNSNWWPVYHYIIGFGDPK